MDMRAANMPAVPVLETDRMILRGHRPDDFDALHATWSDPDVLRFLGITSQSTQDSQSRLLRYIGHWAAYGWGYWLAKDKASGLYVGDIGLGWHRRAIVPEIDTMPEIGWVLSVRFHGKGYATEGATAARDWADRHLDAAQTCAIFHPDNTPSMRIAEKLGYRFWQMGTYHGDTPIWVRDRKIG